jgi:hypothetical protein
MKTLILGVFAFCAACRLSADTVYALVCGSSAGNPVKFSVVGNWSNKNFPVSDSAGTTIRIFGYDKTLLNDLPEDFNIYQLQFT